MRRAARMIGVGSIALTTFVAGFLACVGSDPGVTQPPTLQDGATSNPDGTTTGPDGSTLTDAGSDASTQEDAEASVPKPSQYCDASAVGLVFTTAFDVDPNFNGFAGADNHCSIAAQDGGLCGTFRAWVSIDGQSAPSHVVNTNTTRSYRLVTDAGMPGELVVAAAGALGVTNLAHPIDHNQRGDKVNASGVRVWTGTLANGTGGVGVDAGTCNNWMSVGDALFGIVGDANQLDAKWTDDNSPKKCSGNARLYCFQQ